jgi:arginyl-tRNA synthetase
MKEKIIALIKEVLGDSVPVELSIPDDARFGHYATNVILRLAKVQGKNPLEFAKEIAAELSRTAPEGFFEKVEAAPPGFINFWLSKKTIHDEFAAMAADEHYGAQQTLRGKTVMVEFTDANPFKLFHIGHLMSNAIGESFARLYEAAGANVIRANYQSDVGLHVAKAIWGMREGLMPEESAPLAEKVKFLGDSYARGTSAYDASEDAKREIEKINEAVYSRADAAINDIYDRGRAWSLAYFETIYKLLGTKFDDYFFESEVAPIGLALVLSHKDIFKESEGAIVFPGDEHGVHTRVFVNSRGLPTYEAKELGLNKKKFELHPLDLSVIATGNEIVDYFKVLLKVMEIILPDVASKTRHVPHGMLRLPGGKMASRTGNVVTAEALIEQARAAILERMRKTEGMDDAERDAAARAIAIGAIKYSILKQHPGQDIIFDFDKSLSFEGDSGPYVQYTRARLMSILRKAGLALNNTGHADTDHGSVQKINTALLDSEIELALVRKIIAYPQIVLDAMESRAPSALVTYIYKLASLANKFYETTPILKDEKDVDEARRAARLELVRVAAQTLRSGLRLLGIESPERI